MKQIKKEQFLQNIILSLLLFSVGGLQAAAEGPANTNQEQEQKADDRAKLEKALKSFETQYEDLENQHKALEAANRTLLEEHNNSRLVNGKMIVQLERANQELQDEQAQFKINAEEGDKAKEKYTGIAAKLAEALQLSEKKDQQFKSLSEERNQLITQIAKFKRLEEEEEKEKPREVFAFDEGQKALLLRASQNREKKLKNELKRFKWIMGAGVAAVGCAAFNGNLKFGKTKLLR